jgi:hypothetical protein
MDYGEASNFHATKGAASDALKRAAVHFGIGRYLYRVDGFRVAGERISDTQKTQLRARLPRPKVAASGPAPLYAMGERGDDGEQAEPRAASSAPAKAPATRPAPALVLEDWPVAVLEAKARGVTKDEWERLKKSHGALVAMAKYLATRDVVDTDAAEAASAAHMEHQARLRAADGVAS